MNYLVLTCNNSSQNKHTQGLGKWKALKTLTIHALVLTHFIQQTDSLFFGAFFPLTFWVLVLSLLLNSGFLSFWSPSVNTLVYFTWPWDLSGCCLQWQRFDYIYLGTISCTHRNSRFVDRSYLESVASEYLVWTTTLLCLLTLPYDPRRIAHPS